VVRRLSRGGGEACGRDRGGGTGGGERIRREKREEREGKVDDKWVPRYRVWDIEDG
jgi:hypothetical protein